MTRFADPSVPVTRALALSGLQALFTPIVMHVPPAAIGIALLVG